MILQISFLLMTVTSMSAGQYTPNWESLDSRPLPAWYDKAKVGIFMHFGPYAVPGVESEWFWMQAVRNSSEGDKRCAQYLADYYPPKFVYQDFGPMLTMDFFDPIRIVDIIAASGAKYMVFTSKHHDGYCNWNSTYSYGWNSMAVGPKRNVLQELKSALKQRHPEIHFGLYYSLFEWFNPIYLKDKENNFNTREYALNKMQPELKELIDTFAPELLWVDGDWEAVPEYWGSQDIMAWMFNESPSKDTIVTNDRWGIGTSQKHGSYYSGPDRFSPGTLQAHKWENAMTVDSVSWGYRRNINLDEILSMDSLIGEIVKTVSCGGNILINVGPTKEGTIIPIFEERLRSIGDWLKINGEAIYESKAWNVQNDTSNSAVWYTASADSDFVFAISLGWPENDTLKLGSVEISQTSKATLLGLPTQDLSLDTSEKGETLVHFPSMSKVVSECGSGCQWGYVVKFSGVSMSEAIHNNVILIQNV